MLLGGAVLPIPVRQRQRGRGRVLGVSALELSRRKTTHSGESSLYMGRKREGLSQMKVPKSSAAIRLRCSWLFYLIDAGSSRAAMQLIPANNLKIASPHARDWSS